MSLDDDSPDRGPEWDEAAAMGLPSPVTGTMTDPASLPQWQGRPVPWATRWTGEVAEDPMTFLPTPEGPIITYPDGAVNRDEWGFLWRREGAGRKGEPQFAELNAYRQKQSMRGPKCHVCGRKLPAGPITWLLPKNALSVSPEGRVTTISPPTCTGCVLLGRELCPHLRRGGSDLLLVKRWHVWGVIGEAFMFDGHEPVDRVKDICLQYGRSYKDTGPHTFVVRQQVMALDEYEVIEEGEA